MLQTIQGVYRSGGTYITDATDATVILKPEIRAIEPLRQSLGALLADDNWVEWPEVPPHVRRAVDVVRDVLFEQ
jgi:hypothetical protein